MAEIRKIALGIDIGDMSGLRAAYEEIASDKDHEQIDAVLNGDMLLGFISEYVMSLKEPIYFFLELPCSEDEEKSLGRGSGENKEEHYKLYYLDNCTAPVAQAVLKRFGSLLSNDGLCRFGFGTNGVFDEIYVRSYKVISMFFFSEGSKREAVRLLEKYGAEKTDRLITPWDVISPENPGVCVRVEDDGTSVYDIPDILSEAGMYYAKTVV